MLELQPLDEIADLDPKKKLSSSQRSFSHQSSHRGRISLGDNGAESTKEPPIEAYEDRPGIRIKQPCPLTPDIYTVLFMANVEHWYGLPFEHSIAEIDTMVIQVISLFICKILLISMVLAYALTYTKFDAFGPPPEEHDDIALHQVVIFCRYVACIVLQMAVSPKIA